MSLIGCHLTSSFMCSGTTSSLLLCRFTRLPLIGGNLYRHLTSPFSCQTARSDLWLLLLWLFGTLVLWLFGSLAHSLSPSNCYLIHPFARYKIYKKPDSAFISHDCRIFWQILQFEHFFSSFSFRKWKKKGDKKWDDLRIKKSWIFHQYPAYWFNWLHRLNGGLLFRMYD